MHPQDPSLDSGAVRIGISGWRYEPWRGPFYPRSLPQARELTYASWQFPTIELNGSFYSLLRPRDFMAWYAATPRGFTFSVKASRYLTHVLRLRDLGAPASNFFASGILALREKLGPILWQFPANLPYDRDRFQRFVDWLPHDTAELARLGQGHDTRLADRAYLEVDQNRPVRHAIEVRSHTFAHPEFVDLLRARQVALVVSDSPGTWPAFCDVTADFLYLRLHGDKELYASGYTHRAIARWADRIAQWSRGATPEDLLPLAGPPLRAKRRDVYVYFDNDSKVLAPRDARRLMSRLRLPLEPIVPPEFKDPTCPSPV